MTASDGLVFLPTWYARFPLACRPQSSDRFVFHQVFVEREYACLDDLTHAGLVIDCGAYVGYSSAYFLSRFPGCRVIAVEPDPANFELLALNLGPYGDAARLLRAAVWSHPTRLALSEAPYRDGGEWARQVRECRPGEDSDLPGVDVGGLLRDSGHERITILKVDVEGAEGVIFARNYEAWLDRVDNLVIELHDDSSFGNCSAVFARAIAGRGFHVSRWGELTVCRRPI
jgi:FkbM family methyltransferase